MNTLSPAVHSSVNSKHNRTGSFNTIINVEQLTSTFTSEKKIQKPLPILSRQIPKGKSEVSLSAFAFMYSEYIQYCITKVKNTTDLEKKLSEVGYHVGVRILELISYREKNYKRENALLDLLRFISSKVWKMLFGKNADSLLMSDVSKDEFMITEMQPLSLTKFISVPRDYQGFNCASFVAGIVEGILDSADFGARVTAHSEPIEGEKHSKTTILMKFYPEVMERTNN